MSACHAVKDPKTELAVAIAGGMSTSVFRKVCSGCRVRGRDTRDLARFLRALSRSQEHGSTLQSHLSAVDPKTWAGLFAKAGLPIDSRFVSLRHFLLNQRFVPLTTQCFKELAHLAANDPLFFVETNESKTGTRGA